MDRPTTESGLEFVLDNRKLIGGFLLLMVVCGGFFVFGFIEGKRQALKSEAEKGTVTAPSLAESTGAERKTQASPPDKAEERSVQERLDWYKNVNQRAGLNSKGGGAKSGETPPRKNATTGRNTGTTTARVTPPAVSSTKVSYSVQVGAFRQRGEAESKAALLKSKGYKYILEEPRPPDQYFLLKVGVLDSRAEAIAMQLRLKKDGFPTLVKTNQGPRAQ